MKTWIFIVKESSKWEYIVEADTEEEATTKFHDGDTADQADLCDNQIMEIISVKEWKEEDGI